MSETDVDDTEYGYTEWRCTNCGHAAPKNNPPCNRCGNMTFEQVEVTESDFDEATQAASNVELLRENWQPVTAGIGVVAVVAIVALASTGAFVLADPFGLGFRYGAVDAVTPDDDGTLTAAELHGRVADTYGDSSMQWYGRGLELSYATTAEPGPPLVAEVTEIAGWYAEYVASGGDAASLQITANLADGRARVTVQRADAAAFAAGDISRGEYQSRILASSG